ncbi:hypothetical protein ACFVHI_19880 [Kitasatospora sp. NPDC127121]|uniref:hypothetical protein n=1 Tax=unclassified Kitasatospora TaxID=2633591 RepID=UPI0036451F2A
MQLGRRIQDGRQRRPVPVAGRRAEGVHQPPAADRAALGVRRAGLLCLAAGLVGELAGVRGGPAEGNRDLVDVQAEQLVQHEGDPLGGASASSATSSASPTDPPGGTG